MEGETPACDVDRSWPCLHSSLVPHVRTVDALDRGLRSSVRGVPAELHPYRYNVDPLPATTPAFLASIPETGGFIAADRARRRPRGIDHPARAEFPGSVNELHPRCWTAHSASYGGFYTSLHHRVINDCSQGEFELKLSISYFDGDSGAEDYLDWEQEVDAFFYYACVPPEKQVRCVLRKLRGRARVWWTHMVRARQLEGRREINTWVKMKRLLTFPPKPGWFAFGCIRPFWLTSLVSYKICRIITSWFLTCHKNFLLEPRVASKILPLYVQPYVGISTTVSVSGLFGLGFKLIDIKQVCNMNLSSQWWVALVVAVELWRSDISSIAICVAWVTMGNILDDSSIARGGAVDDFLSIPIHGFCKQNHLKKAAKVLALWLILALCHFELESSSFEAEGI